MASVPVAGAQQTLTEDAAQTIVRPIYDALTASSPEMDRTTLEAATTPDWKNCSTNGACESNAGDYRAVDRAHFTSSRHAFGNQRDSGIGQQHHRAR
jgi:hypothetical protein